MGAGLGGILKNTHTAYTTSKARMEVVKIVINLELSITVEVSLDELVV
ncbi:MAG: hypothetical protein GX561_15985 [Lentisphaerae bacterium]|nr:hypothetical protein [Lentisphaerota bacterium]